MTGIKVLPVFLLSLATTVGTTEPVKAAASFCFEPRAPSLYIITKPRKPYCATSGDGCDSWEIESYRTEVRRYFDQLEQYLSDVERYRKQAHEYAECMAELD